MESDHCWTLGNQNKGNFVEDKITERKSSYSSTLANNVGRSQLPNKKYETIEMEKRECISKEVKKSWQSV